MPSEAEIEQSIARSQALDKLWEETEGQLAEYEREKQAFLGENGMEFEEFLQRCAEHAAEAQQTMDDDTKAELSRQREQLEEEFERDVARAKSQRDTERTRKSSGGQRRTRRLRNMV